MKQITSMLRRLATYIRESGRPRVLTIAEPALPPEWRARLEEILAQPPAAPASVHPPASPQELPENAAEVIGRACAFLWKLQQWSAQPGCPYDKKTLNLINKTMDRLTQKGCRIIDHTGEKIVEGRLMDILSKQRVAGLSEPVVSQTQTPSVFFMSQHVLRAEVYVDIPQEQKED